MEVRGTKRNHNWSIRAEQNEGFVRIVQDQGEPNGLQVVLLSPKQMTALKKWAI